MVKQSALHPHNLSAKRIAQMEKWRLLGAQARRGQHTARRELAGPAGSHSRRTRKGRSLVGAYGKATGWGLQKMVMPVGPGLPVIATLKNRIPGYNQLQIAKATTRRTTRGKHKGRLG